MSLAFDCGRRRPRPPGPRRAGKQSRERRPTTQHNPSVGARPSARLREFTCSLFSGGYIYIYIYIYMYVYHVVRYIRTINASRHSSQHSLSVSRACSCRENALVSRLAELALHLRERSDEVDRRAAQLTSVASRFRFEAYLRARCAIPLLHATRSALRDNTRTVVLDHTA